MSGYATSARLQGGSTRFVPVAESRSDTSSGIGVSKPPAGLDLREAGWIELVGRPFGERLAARWDDLCEMWSQTTFFLFDPESWR